jgi:hypothetical protein
MNRASGESTREGRSGQTGRRSTRFRHGSKPRHNGTGQTREKRKNEARMEEQHWMTLVRVLDAPLWVSWVLALVAIPVLIWLGLYMRHIDREEAPVRSDTDQIQR